MVCKNSGGIDMCFSASASFASGAVLSIVGIASMRKAVTPSHLAFGGIPFIFAVQQFSEGFVWLSLTNASYAGWQEVSTYIFLIFAHIVWPTWIPFSIVLIETKMKRKNILFLLSGVGLALSFYYAFSLVFYPVTARVNGYHIQYILEFPVEIFALNSLLYGMAAILPIFISSIKRMWWFGIFIIISYIATYLIYNSYIISVWCYFAALLSIIIYWIINSINKDSDSRLLSKLQEKPAI